MNGAKEFLLSAAAEGDVVILRGFESSGRRAHRLAELGLTPGIPIRVLRAAPGQPILIQVRGTRLAVDRETAACMRVRMHRPCPRRRHRRRTGWGRRGGRPWSTGLRGLGRGWWKSGRHRPPDEEGHGGNS